MKPVTPPAKAWANRNFRWIWAASAASFFGSEIGEIALPLLALITLDASATQISFLRAMQFAPFLLATMPFGVLVDRSRRRPLMIGADIGRFLLTAAIPLLIWAGLQSMGPVYGLVFGVGTLTVLYQVAEFAFQPLAVTTRQLPDANAKIVATQQAASIGGRGLGGLFVQALTAPVAIAVNAVTYLLSAASLSRADVAESRPAPEERVSSAWGEVKEGLRITLANRFVRGLLGEATTFNFFNEIFMLGLTIYAIRHLHLGAAGLGLILMVGGFGSFLGAWFGTRATARFGYGRVLLATLAVGNTVPAAAVLSTRGGPAALTLLCAIFLISGVGVGVANAHAITVRQLALPEQARGRVNAAYRLVSWGVIPIGTLVGGVIAQRYGPWSAELVGGIGVAIATVWVAFSPVPRLRSVEDAAMVRQVATPPAG
jgi:MFS family permease